MHHPSRLNPKVVAKVVARRGRLHAYETMPASSTVLVVIDLHTASVERDPACRALVPRINDLAAAVGTMGGTVAWVTPAPLAAPDASMLARYGKELSRIFATETQGEAAALWPDLAVNTSDIAATKRGESAFFPGRCALPDELHSRGITHVLIAGTVTNVCCESSARDAVQQGFAVTMVSDACVGHAHGLHEATLTTFYRNFGDVRPIDDVIALLTRASSQD